MVRLIAASLLLVFDPLAALLTLELSWDGSIDAAMPHIFSAPTRRYQPTRRDLRQRATGSQRVMTDTNFAWAGTFIETRRNTIWTTSPKEKIIPQPIKIKICPAFFRQLCGAEHSTLMSDSLQSRENKYRREGRHV
jgi:hypothetical protein